MQGTTTRLKNLHRRAVTGAAGLGKAVALRLANEGAAVEILDLNDGNEAVAEIKVSGGEAHSTIFDCSDEEQFSNAVKEIEARRGHIDILVNNAGIPGGRKPWHEPLER